MMHSTEKYFKLISDALHERSYGAHPVELYEPISYIMGLGGKRMRPMLVLMAYGLFRDDPEEIVEQALAVEVFHNFTLMHDDIMDRAPLRRGQPSVHAKWNDSKFGKQVGGDIIANKKTYLMLKSLEAATGENKANLDNWLSVTDFDPVEKVQAVTQIYKELGIDKLAKDKMDAYFDEALVHLRKVDAPMPRITTLKNFAIKLIKRDS